MTTLDQDRRQVSEVLAMFETHGAIEWDEWLRMLTERYGVAPVDQLKAASAEAHQRAIIRSERDMQRLPHQTTVREPRFQIMLYAGVLRCLANHACEHAVAGLRPLGGMLAARVLTCDECYMRGLFGDVLARHDAAIDDDRVCDVCLVGSQETFHAFRVAWGPAVLMGDMCPSCAAVANLPTVADRKLA